MKYIGGPSKDDGGDNIFCEMVKLGEGKVIKTLNSHYSTVKTDGSFPLQEGLLVEKKKK